MAAHRTVADNKELGLGKTVEHDARGAKKTRVVLLRAEQRKASDHWFVIRVSEFITNTTFSGRAKKGWIHSIVDDAYLVIGIAQVIDHVLPLRLGDAEV